MVITDLALTAAMENISHMLLMISGYLQFTAAYSTSIYCGSHQVCKHSLFCSFLETVVQLGLGEVRVCSRNL